MIKQFCYIVATILLIFMSSCEFINGEYSMGNHLWLWDNDKENNAIIVYCEGQCHGGIQVIPTRERQTNSGEYVKKAVSNNKWVIVKTFRIKEKLDNYYIISKNFDIVGLDCAKANCDSILQSHVIGPIRLTEFLNRKRVLNIALDF